MIVLGIDTSFDDTAAAVVDQTVILSNVLSSQLPLYQQWGGVVPSLARQSHQQNIDLVIARALNKTGKNWSQVDCIAVTYGPGLALALEVGIEKAKELAARYNKPLVAVNHMEGHLLSVLAQAPKRVEFFAPQAINQDLFPALGVLVSGGHTEFVLTKQIGEYTIVGQTHDDAMGEAFDKVGRMLGLGYPAGATVELLARKGTPGAVVFPVPMRSVKDANTSFSGLKTAAQRIIESMKIQRDGTLSAQDISDIAYGFQIACITHIQEKLRFALAEYPVNAVFLAGGVAANRKLRVQLRVVTRQHGIPLLVPHPYRMCMDNAAMIAIAGYFKAQRGEFVESPETLDRVPNLRF